MHEIIDGIKEGINLAFTLHPKLDIGTRLVNTPGFPNLIVIIVLTCFGVLTYQELRKNTSSIISSYRSIGLVIVAILLAIAWSGMATIFLIGFYFWGSFVGFIVGVQNGYRLRESHIMKIGLVIGILIIGLLITYLPNSLKDLIQVSIVAYLTWDAISENMSLVRLPQNPTFNLIMVIGGTLSLCLLTPDAFQTLLVEASKTTSFKTEGNLTLIKVLAFSPVAGILFGIFALWPAKN